MEYKRYPHRFFRHLLLLPFALFFLPMLILLDLMLSCYHLLAYPLMGLEKVKKKQYFQLDRHKLAYLRRRERIYAIYTAYANGLFRFAKKLASDSEWYWCGIKHQKVPGYLPDKDQDRFMDFGDKGSYRLVMKTPKKRFTKKKKKTTR